MQQIGYGNAATTGAAPFWVEHPNGAVFFAMNIDTPNRMADVAKRQIITRQILRSIAACRNKARSAP